MKPRALAKQLKEITKEFVGPSNYTSGGFSVQVGELEKISKVKSIHVLGGGEYISQIVNTTGNNATVKVRGNIEQAVDEGGTSTYTIGGEVAAGTNLSGVTFEMVVEGY